MRPYNYDILVSELRKVSSRHEGNPDLAKCGELFRKAVRASKKKGYIDADTVFEYLKKKAAGSEDSLYTDLIAALEKALIKTKYTIVYSETFEKEYAVEAYSFDNAVSKLRKHLENDSSSRPKELVRTETFRR